MKKSLHLYILIDLLHEESIDVQYTNECECCNALPSKHLQLSLACPWLEPPPSQFGTGTKMSKSRPRKPKIDLTISYQSGRCLGRAGVPRTLLSQQFTEGDIPLTGYVRDIKALLLAERT